MATDISLNKNGTVTLYSGGKKVMSGTLAQIVAHLGGEGAALVKPPKPRKVKPLSRSARWAAAASAAVSALEELEDMRAEFEEWKDNLPENLQQSALGEKLSTVSDLDIQGALDTAEEAENADLPMGFGRD
jgi:hypothetical protein